MPITCRNRHCPRCQGAAARAWLAEREAELLPVPYYHLVFTLPAAVADIAYQNKATIYDILFKASSETIIAIAADPKHLGALDALSVAITSRKVNHILDADVRDFFGSVNHDWLIRFLEHRIGDKRIIRLIRKWLKAGILEDGVVTVADSGTGQGSVISPLLGNIYLHSLVSGY